jgi:monosaccharide-transporting ATPase
MRARRSLPARACGLARKGALAPLDLECTAASCWACAACWAPAAPKRRACCSAPTGWTAAPSTSGQSVSLATPRDAIAQGIGFCSEDRKHEGAILPLSVRENLILACRRARASARDSLKRQQQLAHDYVNWLGIKTASIETPIGALSGGNQQKVLLARWLATEPAC